MHLAAILISIILIVSGYVFMLKSVNEQFQIQYEINLKLPNGAKFEPTLWWYGTWRKFRRLHRELLPDSPRPKRLRKFQIAGVMFLTAGLLILVSSLETWPQ